jgi:hypothetical protein
VDVVGSHHVVEDTQAKAFFGFKEPGMPATSVFCEFQKKFFFVTTWGKVPHLPWNVMECDVDSRVPLLAALFCQRKHVSKNNYN